MALSSKFKAILFFWLIAAQPLFSQSSNVIKKTDIEEAGRVVEAFYAENRIPGMSISVYRDGDMIWSEGFGYTDLENGISVDPSATLFRIGSVSKTFTAAAVGLLMEQGTLDLEQPVQSYVPGFPSKQYPVTVEQIAGHIGGIRHYRGDEMMSGKRYNSIDEGLRIFSGDTLLFEPGTSYSYSSYGWNLISAVVEGASGEDFLSFMETDVFQQLNMDHTMPDYAYREIPDRTRFYTFEEGQNKEAPYVDNSYKWAGGGFLSTTEDMIRFGEAHLSAGFLEQQTLGRLMQPLETADGESTGYGIGWATIKDPEGNIWKGHSGGSVGGSTMFMMHPDKDVIIAFAINRSDVAMTDLRDELALIFID